MKQTINVEGINLYAYHGCLEEEGRVGAEYIVNVNMVVDFTQAAITDDLLLTIDYCTVYDICKQEMVIRAKLIEQVGQRIFDKIKTTFPQLTQTKVTIIKLLPPMNGNVDRVFITIED